MRGAFLYSLSFVEILTSFSGADVTFEFGKCSSGFILNFRHSATLDLVKCFSSMM